MDYNAQFEGMPEIPQSIINEALESFEKYLIFETKGKNSREYICSACGERFTVGAKHMHEVMPAEEFALWHAPHNSYATCPHCGAYAVVKSFQKCNVARFSECRYIAIMMPMNHDEIWVRCIEVYRRFYNDMLAMRKSDIEWARYRFRPGKALFWQKEYASEDFRTPRRTFGEPFRWDSGLSHTAYTYDFVYGNDMRLEDTFLKYSAMEEAGKVLYNLPPLQWLCYYSVYPQIEMLAKMKHRDILFELVQEHRENKNNIDWSAKKPWELYRLPRADYNEWQKRGGDLQLYKVYRRIHGSGAKDFEVAKELCEIFGHRCYGTLSHVYRLIAKARKVKTDVRDILKYIKKVQAASSGGCWHCPGITMYEAATLWLDYIELAEKAGKLGTISPTPKDLKAEHDALIKAAKRAEEAKRKKDLAKAAKQAAARIQKEAEALEKKYPKVRERYAKIGEKYAYANEKYTIVVPTGIADIITEGEALDTCLSRVERYYDNIERGESYIFFLRKTEDVCAAYYTLEVEPSGTIRQKRTVGDTQNPDINEATEFFREWQKVIAERLSDEDKFLSEKSRELRKKNFAELREKKTVVRNGYLRGKLLADVLEADLLEIEFDKTPEEAKKIQKVG